MILTGEAITSAVRTGDVVISPFRPEQVSPNSYDFRLGNRCAHYVESHLDAAKPNPVFEYIIPTEGFIANPNTLYLINTEETIGSNKFVPIIRGRSSAARLGIFIHITADLIDIGSIGQLTLQVHTVRPVRLYPSMLIGQVTFWTVQGPITCYAGKYRDAKRPTASLSHYDFAERS